MKRKKNKNNGLDEPIYRKKQGQRFRKQLMVAKGKERRGKLGDWD